MYGATLRMHGSLHADTWSGTAAQLASKSQIAVWPVGGWWKDWSETRQHDREARYALIISLKVLGDVEADIYTPIATSIAADAAIPIDIDVPDGDEPQ
ncbi:hypothetical protein [Paraburkholderia susongensis]|uniref:hypothetical protein n=1 Tax=Paraburkholderia susongensis TaxID=1515439 RepID=UPI001ABFB2D6|nr:hypothetical protein [Paraburkholderia susongensis]